MRKITFYLEVLAVCCLQIAMCSQLHAQGVGINTTGNPADNSAMLDVSSTNLGILIPRMTTAQMNAISLPATGLIIYNTDCNNLNYNAGTPGSPNWVTINSTAGTPGNITGSASVCANQTGVTYSIAAVSGATSYNWTVPSGATITAGTGTSGITLTFGTNGGNVCVSAVNSCGTSNASCITVTVYNGNLTAGTISSNQTICSGATSSALTFTTPPTGGIGAYTYQWYNGTGSLGSAATNSTYSPGALTPSGIISTESFDGTTFPPTGWGNTVISDPDCPGASSLYCPFAWMRTTGGVWITEDLSIPESPHSGAGEAWYDSWDAGVGDEAILVSPSFSEAGNTSGATVSLWMFATDEDTHDLVNVWYSTSPTQPTSTSGASLLGTVYQYNAVNGWYKHTYTIPSTVTSSTVWLIFDAVSAFGIEMYIDDVSWTAIPPTTTTNYYCSVTSGCTVTTDTVTVAINALPPASITGTTIICSGNSTTLTASGGGTYLWSTGDNTAAITESPTSNTTYTVTVTNGAGCNATASATVTVNTGVPTAPVAGTNIPSVTQIVWNWSTVSGATGYRWGTTSSYSSATDIGTSTSYTQTGLTCNITYTLYVWAYNSCGNSSATELTQSTTTIICPSSFTDSRDGTTYSAVLIGCQCWMAQNLNYGTQVTSSTTPTTYGQKLCYNDNAANCTTYGALYELSGLLYGPKGYCWDSTSCEGVCTDVTNCANSGDNQACSSPTQSICPAGWHVPSFYEWIELFRNAYLTSGSSGTSSILYSSYQGVGNGTHYLGTEEGSDLKSTNLWTSNTCSPPGLCNSSGFNALPAGSGGELNINGIPTYIYGSYNYTSSTRIDDIWTDALFWQSTYWGNGCSWYFFHLNNADSRIWLDATNYNSALSVRCVHN